MSERIAHVAARASVPVHRRDSLPRHRPVKHVNHTYGHGAGDELLIAVAHRLSDLVRPGDTLARISGYEFVMLCEDLTRRTDIDALATRIDSAFGTPFVVTAGQLNVTASVSIASAGTAASVSDELIANAEAAASEAKRDRAAGQHIIDLRHPRTPGRP